jgi:hypothetical protein
MLTRLIGTLLKLGTRVPEPCLSGHNLHPLKIAWIRADHPYLIQHFTCDSRVIVGGYLVYATSESHSILRGRYDNFRD